MTTGAGASLGWGELALAPFDCQPRWRLRCAAIPGLCG